MEVGLRKVLGSAKGNLIGQFLTESVLFSVLSFIIACLVAAGILPFFNVVADKTIAIPWLSWWFLPLMILSAAGVGIIAGIYPSFYLSAFKPIQVMRGQLSRGHKSVFIRNALVVFQFAVSIILIAGTLVVHRQMNYILNKEVGFNKDQVLLLQGAQTLEAHQVASLKAQLELLTPVKSVSVSDFLPVSGTKRDGNTFHRLGVEQTQGTGAQKWTVDYDYIRTMGMEIVAGRDFRKDMATDSQAVNYQ